MHRLGQNDAAPVDLAYHAVVAAVRRAVPALDTAVVLLPVHLTGCPRLVALVPDYPADDVRRRHVGVGHGEPQGDTLGQHADAAAVRAVHRSALLLGQPAGDVHRERPRHRPAGIGLGGRLLLTGGPEVVVEEPTPRRTGLGGGAVRPLEHRQLLDRRPELLQQVLDLEAALVPGGELPEADLSRASLLALGGTGADAERWVRGARRRARHDGRDLVIDDVLDEIRGLQRARTADEAYRYAVHEAGHALVLVVEEPGALVSASIRQTGDTQGGVLADRRDRRPVTRREIATRLRMLLAGRVAEEVVFGDVSTGAGGDASSDLAQATMLAAAALNAYGLEDGVDGLLWRGLPTPDTLPVTLSWRPDMAAQVSAMLADGYAEARDLIHRHRGGLEAIARLLVERETVGGKEIESLFRSEGLLTR
ncbi:hypothetical protein FW320_00520 [Azospirillum sp. Vi22]|nr:hypothetical protein [Azospirillum baldaniorum]